MSVIWCATNTLLHVHVYIHKSPALLTTDPAFAFHRRLPADDCRVWIIRGRSDCHVFCFPTIHCNQPFGLAVRDSLRSNQQLVLHVWGTFTVTFTCMEMSTFQYWEITPGGWSDQRDNWLMARSAVSHCLQNISHRNYGLSSSTTSSNNAASWTIWVQLIIDKANG